MSGLAEVLDEHICCSCPALLHMTQAEHAAAAVRAHLAAIAADEQVRERVARSLYAHFDRLADGDMRAAQLEDADAAVAAFLAAAEEDGA